MDQFKGTGFQDPQTKTNDTEDMAYRQRVAQTDTGTAPDMGTARGDMALGSQYGVLDETDATADFKRGVKNAGDSNRAQSPMERNGVNNQTVGMQAMGDGNYRSPMNDGSGDESDDLNLVERGAEASVDDERVPEQVIPEQEDGVTMGKRPQEHDVNESQSQGQMYEKAGLRGQ